MSRLSEITASGRTILVVDDQAETLESVRALLRREGHRVLVAGSGARALALLAENRVDVVIADYFMPVMNGEVLIRAIRERDSLVQIILQTGYAGDKPPREMLQRLAIQGYHDKSEGPERLLVWVDVALKGRDLLAQTQAAERVKSEFLANVSHELRTPLNIILGYVDLVREGEFGACASPAIDTLGRVSDQAHALLGMVEKLLDLSQLEAGATTACCEPIALEAFVRDVVAPHTLLLEARSVALRVDVPATLPVALAEPAKLRTILQTLVASAAKVTEDGEVTITAEPLPDGRIALRVRDGGPPIPAAAREALFDLVTQLEPREAGPRGGLGLAVAHRFARLMDGDLTVDDAGGEGGGGAFTLVLPRATSAAAAGALTAAPGVHDAHRPRARSGSAGAGADG